MLANEVAYYTCKFCHSAIPPALSVARHEQQCLKNPRWLDKPEPDMRASNRYPDVPCVREGMRVITINLSTKIVQSIDDRVHEHEWTSRSEFIRAAVNMLVAQLKPSGGRQ